MISQFELQKVQQSPSDRQVHLKVIRDSREQLNGVGKIFDAVLEAIGDDPVDAWVVVVVFGSGLVCSPL